MLRVSLREVWLGKYGYKYSLGRNSKPVVRTISMHEPRVGPSRPFVFTQEQDANSRKQENGDAGEDREGVIDHEQRTPEHRRNHPASVGIDVSG